MQKGEKLEAEKNMQSNFRFTPEDFRNLLIQQDYKCFLTRLPLNAQNVDAEHIKPLRKGGKHRIENICLVIDSVRELKRFHSEKEIYQIAKLLIKVYESKKTKKKK